MPNHAILLLTYIIPFLLLKENIGNWLGIQRKLLININGSQWVCNLTGLGGNSHSAEALILLFTITHSCTCGCSELRTLEIAIFSFAINDFLIPNCYLIMVFNKKEFMSFILTLIKHKYDCETIYRILRKTQPHYFLKQL